MKGVQSKQIEFARFAKLVSLVDAPEGSLDSSPVRSQFGNDNAMKKRECVECSYCLCLKFEKQRTCIEVQRKLLQFVSLDDAVN